MKTFLYKINSILFNLKYIFKRGLSKILYVLNFIYGIFWAYVFSLTNIIPGTITLNNITIDNVIELYNSVAPMLIAAIGYGGL